MFVMMANIYALCMLNVWEFDYSECVEFVMVAIFDERLLGFLASYRLPDTVTTMQKIFRFCVVIGQIFTFSSLWLCHSVWVRKST